MDRYTWLETQLDRDDLSDADFDSYNKELNQLHAARQERRAKREAELEAMRLEEVNTLALEKIMVLTEEEVEKMYVRFYTDHFAQEMSYDVWFAKSTRYYTITDNFTVISKARSANTEERIEHVNLAQAKLTILKRIRYKFYDHFVKGHDFAWHMEDDV